MESYLVLFHVVSAGQNATDLGADEEQIVHLSYAIVDKAQNKVKYILKRSFLGRKIGLKSKDNPKKVQLREAALFASMAESNVFFLNVSQWNSPKEACRVKKYF